MPKRDNWFCPLVQRSIQISLDVYYSSGFGRLYYISTLKYNIKIEHSTVNEVHTKIGKCWALLFGIGSLHPSARLCFYLFFLVVVSWYFFLKRLPFPMMVEPDPTLSGYLPVLRSACPTIWANLSLARTALNISQRKRNMSTGVRSAKLLTRHTIYIQVPYRTPQVWDDPFLNGALTQGFPTKPVH